MWIKIVSLGGTEFSLLRILNTSPEIVKSNYLNYSDEWARNRFKVLGYDKRKLPQTSMKSKNKVSTKS
ncbi:hypothetical protein OAM22_02015 [Candidatus Pelagibacter sp.]|nr:hypothetical protein [Candidatus Pelagibacter sp.]